LNITELESKTRDELLERAKSIGVSGASGLKKQDLILRLLQVQSETEGNLLSGGVIDIVDDGYGFLRGESLLPTSTDVYVSQSQVRRFALRPGDYVTGQVRAPKSGEKYYGLLQVDLVNGMDPEEARKRPNFENQTAIFPNEQFILETTEDPGNLSGRLIDLVSPLGQGQRGLIVSPPKAGKTMLLQSIAEGVISNHESVHLIVVLVGERPEEVTEMRRTVRGEVVSSTFDDPVEDHTRVAEMALERAKRLMESGRDVVILCDSITRLARAYNLEMPTSGKTLTGGMDPVALYPPKRFFGAARKAEEGGSLTIIATCLIDTGSRLDDLIYEEFKGTGNWEVHLDRKLAERRVFPAIDIARSGTRREELLLTSDTLQKVWLLRRMMSMLSSGNSQTEPTERLLERLSRTKTNEEFLSSLTTADT
jgi:transcription termination factor Rho